MADERKPPRKPKDGEPTQPEFELEAPGPDMLVPPEPTGPSLSPFLDAADLPSNDLPPPSPPEDAPPRNFLASLAHRIEGLRVGERLARFGLREKLVRILPKSASRKLPQTFDPARLAQWAEQSLAKKELSKYGWGSVVVLSSFFLADLTSLLLGRFIPEPPPIRVARSSSVNFRAARTLDAYQAIFSRNLFSSRGIIPGDELGGDALANDGGLDGPATRTTLPIHLVGTIILKDELRSLATIEDKTAAQVYPVRVDDEVPGKFRVLMVGARRVEFINTSTGRKEYVELPEDTNISNPRITLGGPKKGAVPGIEQTAPNQFNIAKSAIDAAMADMSKVLTQARAVPHNENGQMVGFKLFSIVPGSIYDQLGLKNGDLLCGVNGEPVNDPAKAMTLVTGIKDMSRLELCVKRDGRTQNYNYDIR